MRTTQYNQSYSDLIEGGWRIYSLCKKKDVDKTIKENNSYTQWFFALWPVKNYVVAWCKKVMISDNEIKVSREQSDQLHFNDVVPNQQKSEKFNETYSQP